MRVLIGCEESGVVRDAFRALGHEAMSCDIQPSREIAPHYQGDVFDVIDYPWDLAIFHPPCTHLSVSGAKHFEAKRMDGRQQAAVSFFMQLVRRSAHIPMVAIENPVCVMSSLYRKPDQTIQPWMFNHPERKATCLWLKGLKPLVPISDLRQEMASMDRSITDRIHRMPPGPLRARERSATYRGIAEQMAIQWGGECTTTNDTDTQGLDTGLLLTAVGSL